MKCNEFAKCGNCGATRSVVVHKLTKAEKVPDDKWDRFSLFALLPGGKLQDIWIDLHLLLWKQLIALLVRVELEVWAPAWTRLKEKNLTLWYRVNEALRRAESRGEEPPDVSKRTRWLDPLASFDETGAFEWNKELYSQLENLCKKKAPSGPGR